MPRTPAELLADYDDGCQGRRDIDMRAILHEIIEDVRESYRMAIAGETHQRVLDRIDNEVDDYLANHYGDD